MKQQLQSYLKIFIVIMSLALLTTANFFQFYDNAAAQEDSTNIRTFFERMRQRLIDETYLVVHIQFEHPLVEDEDVWSIGDSNAEYIRGIVEIGDDYICFNELRGAAEIWHCTPFSNIVSVSFLNN